MVEAMHQRDIQVVIMQYPLLKIDSLKAAIWKKNHVLFVENQWLFKKVVLEEGLAAYSLMITDILAKRVAGSWHLTWADKILKYLEKD